MLYSQNKFIGTPTKNNTILSDNYLINSNQILGLVQFKIYMYVCMYVCIKINV